MPFGPAIVRPARSAGAVGPSGPLTSMNASGDRLYMSTIAMSAPFAAERMTEVAPTANRNWMSPEARAAVCSGPVVSSE